MSLLNPLKHKPYRRLFSGQVSSDLANWLDFLALNTLIVYHWGLGAEAVASLLITLGLPWVVIGPMASIWTSRFPPKLVLLTCDILRLAIVLCFLWAPSLYLLLFLVFLKGTFSSIFDPVKQASIRRLVPSSLLAEASSLSQLSVNLTKIIAPALGGLILAMFGVEACFIGSALLYGLSACYLFGLPSLSKLQEENKDQLSFKENVLEGWGHIHTHFLLRLAVIFMAVSFFATFLYDGLFILFTRELGWGESSLGLLMSAVGMGSVTGALVTGQKTEWKHAPLAYMCKAGLWAGGIIILVGLGNYHYLPSSMPFWSILFLLLGYNSARATVPFGYILQMETPAHLIGRVSATTNAIQTGSMLTAPAIGAFVANSWGIGLVFIAVGIGKIILAFLFIIWLKRRHPTTITSETEKAV